MKPTIRRKRVITLIQKDKISQLQLISIGACYLVGTTVVSVFMSSLAGNASWAIGFFGAMLFIPVVLIYVSLAKKYPGKGLFEINEAVFGSLAGRALSLLYCVFFLFTCALNIFEASNFVFLFILPGTPYAAIVGALILACIYGANKGIFVIARVSTIFGLLAGAGVLFNVGMSLTHEKFEYLLPLFSGELLDYIQSTHVVLAIPFGESLVLMTLIPDMDKNVNLKKTYFILIMITAVVMALVHTREIISLGPILSYSSQPSFEAVRMTEIANIFSRIESIFALLLVSLTFFKAIMLLVICLRGIERVFRLESHRHFIIMLALIVGGYVATTQVSSGDNIYWGKNISPFVWSFFTAAIPLLTLVSSWIKGLVGKIVRRTVQK